MIKVGQRLRGERIKKGLTIDEVSRALKIKAAFLSAIEEGDYKKLPSSAYIKGFLKNYTQFLGLPYEEILSLFKREFDEKEYLEVMPAGMSRNKLSTTHFRLNQSYAVFAVILIVIGYIIFQYRAAFINPSLYIYSPKKGEVVGKVIIVKGKTDPNATVFVNDKQVSVDDNGNFQKDITVFPGNIVIDIVSENQFGRKTEKSYTLQAKS